MFLLAFVHRALRERRRFVFFEDFFHLQHRADADGRTYSTCAARQHSLSCFIDTNSGWSASRIIRRTSSLVSRLELTLSDREQTNVVLDRVLFERFFNRKRCSQWHPSFDPKQTLFLFRVYAFTPNA
ncbi:unnamed protein product [Laminaria digitata]